MRSYCAIFQDGFELKIAVVEKQGSKLKVLNFLSVPCYENSFVYINGNIQGNDITEELHLDLGEIGEKINIKTNLNELVNFYPVEDLAYIPVISEPYITYLVHHTKDFKKNVNIKNQLASAWKEITNFEFTLENIDYIEYKNGCVVSTIVQENIPILNEIRSLSNISETKSLNVLPLRSGDIALTNYVLRLYKPSVDDIYLIIYLGSDSIRLLFIKEGKLVHINRYLGFSFDRQGLISFLSSKIVLEMEYARISELTDIVVVGEVNDETVSAIKQSFPFAKVNLLDFQLFSFATPDEELMNKAHSYALPLVAAYDEVYPFQQIKKNLEIHSRRLSKISFFKRIDFLSIFLSLVLIGLILFSFETYNERKKSINEYKDRITRLINSQAIPASELAKINALSQRHDILNSYKQSLEEVLKNKINWTDQLLLIDFFNPTKNKMWITSINIDDKNSSAILIKGLAIDRSKIPPLMSVLNNAELNNIYIYEIRNKKIYQFEISSKF